MDCRACDEQVEAWAAGEPMPPAAETHVAACPRCAASLALARRIEQALAARPVPPPPPAFTAAVLARVRRQRWRTEQAIDVGFNVAVAAGLLIVASGVLGLVYASGLSVVVTDLVDLTGRAMMDVAARSTRALPTYAVAAALVTSALALWWWVEEGSGSSLLR